MDKELGRIKSTMLGFEDHGIFSFMIYFDFGGSGQGFGGYCLDKPKFKDGEEKGFLGRFGTAGGCDLIMKILRAVGVEKWEDLVGKECWVFKGKGGFFGKIIGIEAPAYRSHEGRFMIEEHFKKWEDKSENN